MRETHFFEACYRALSTQSPGPLLLSVMLFALFFFVCDSPTCVIALASDEGNYAREELADPHGYYTSALLDALQAEGDKKSVMELLARVSHTVSERTGGGQRPSPIGTVGSDVFVVDVHGGRILPGPNPDGVTLRSAVEAPIKALRKQVRFARFCSPVCASGDGGRGGGHCAATVHSSP